MNLLDHISEKRNSLDYTEIVEFYQFLLQLSHISVTITFYQSFLTKLMRFHRVYRRIYSVNSGNDSCMIWWEFDENIIVFYNILRRFYPWRIKIRSDSTKFDENFFIVFHLTATKSAKLYTIYDRTKITKKKSKWNNK